MTNSRMATKRKPTEVIKIKRQPCVRSFPPGFAVVAPSSPISPAVVKFIRQPCVRTFPPGLGAVAASSSGIQGVVKFKRQPCVRTFPPGLGPVAPSSPVNPAVVKFKRQPCIRSFPPGFLAAAASSSCGSNSYCLGSASPPIDDELRSTAESRSRFPPSLAVSNFSGDLSPRSPPSRCSCSLCNYSYDSPAVSPPLADVHDPATPSA